MFFICNFYMVSVSWVDLRFVQASFNYSKHTHIFKYTLRRNLTANTYRCEVRSPAKKDMQINIFLSLTSHFSKSVWFHICFLPVSFHHVFSNADVLPVQCVQWVRLSGKTQVAFFVEPHSQWVPVSDQKPLTYIKLGAMDQQGVLQVLLHHPLALLYKGLITVHQAEDLI